MPNTFKTAPNQRSKSKVAIAIILALAVAIGAAFAFLTAKDEKINTFTYGKVDIEVIEPKWDAANPDGIIEKVVPTKSYDKDPQITNTGDNDAYVYMRVWMPKVDGVDIFVDTQQADGTYVKKNQNDVEIFTTSKNSNSADTGSWSLIDGYEYKDETQAYNYYVYAYSVPLAPNETSATLFDKITATNIASGEECIIDEYSNIVVEGFAIQADTGDTTFATAEDAWAMYVKQEGYQWPDNLAMNVVSYFNVDHMLMARMGYTDATETFIVNQEPSVSEEDGEFIGWVGDNGILYQNGDEVSPEELFINNQEENVILNINPSLNEYAKLNNPDENTDQVMLVPNPEGWAEEETNLMYYGGTIYGCPITIDRQGQSVSEYTPSTSNWFVTGFPERTRVDWISDYVKVQGDGYLSFEKGSYTGSKTFIGTGDKITVYNRNGTEDTSDDTIAEVLYVVIFGDFNGDSSADTADASLYRDFIQGYVTYEELLSMKYNIPAIIKAGDINKDSKVNMLDAYNIEEHSLGILFINIQTGLIERH